MAEKAANLGPQLMRMAEKSLVLQILDQSWKDHLLALDHLRQGIGLRAYGQRDPLNEYKREAFDLFETMLDQFRGQVVTVLANLELRQAEPEPAMFQPQQVKMTMIHEDPAMADASGLPPPDEPLPAGMARASGRRPAGGESAPAGMVFNESSGRYIDPQQPESWGRVARNAPCPCGSGKKYKHCHGTN
jgi:preprotein translocase subunit SecA